MSNWLKFWLTLGLIGAVALITSMANAYPVKTTSDLAAWVQAIGSVAAIGAAIWIDRGSERRLLAQEGRARARAVEDWEACLGRVLKLAENAERIASQGDGQTFDDTIPARLIDNAIMMIDTYLRQPPPSPQLAFALAAARSYLKVPRDVIRHRREIPPEFGPVRLSAVARIRAALRATSESIDILSEEYRQGLY